MSLPGDVLVRGRSPRLRLAPPWATSDAADACFLASSYGLTPDPWQADVLEGWLGRTAAGRWSALTCGLAVPRQNGKNGIVEVRELFGMIVLGEKFLHTAHEVKTARKAFARLKSFFENPRRYPELAALVADVRNANGQEAIYLKNGASCEFIARSKNSGRGFTVDVLVADEAQEMSEEALEALLPTTSAAPLGDPQWIYTGTPPGPKASGEVFTRLRTDGLERADLRLSWDEWSVEGDVDLDDHRIWYETNPALGGRLQLDVVEGERHRFSDDGFARERLGAWSEASTSRVIDVTTWEARADQQSKAVDRLSLGIDVTPDRSLSSVSLAGLRADGQWHVELDENRKGVGWLESYVADRCDRNDIRAVAIDGYSPAATLIDPLTKRGINVVVTGPQDMARACGSVYDGVMDGWLHHTDQVQLNSALGAARRRPLGDAWAWNRKNSASDITPLVSVTLALFAAQTSKVKVRTGRASFL